ncbi:MAG: DUF3868 domain-containing protein [Rikenellaceae bacterium]|nr:DUF3868 domain-containing protein [Rikenellaceae bacterium]
MNRIIFTILLFLTFNIISYSQYRIGGVTIDPIQLKEDGDSLLLEMNIFVDGKAMNNCQSWTIMPSLVTADSAYVLDMPYALINGKKKSQLFRRKIKFENERLLDNMPYIKVDKKAGADAVITYQFTAPYELWMDSASLYLNQILTSCVEKEQWFVLEGIKNVDLMQYIPYTINSQVNYIVPEKETKILQLEGSAFLDFEVGRSVILPNFRRNPQELAKIDDVLNRVQGDEDFEILRMYVTGYASPEGSWESNNKLSKARAEALKQYIKNKFRIPEELFVVDNVAEDWDGLIEMINKGEMDGKYRVLETIASTDVFDGRERLLMNLDGGRPYRYMLREMFPSLRRVEYKVEFNVKEYSLEEAEAIMEKNPEQLNQYELFILAQNYPENSPERDHIFGIIQLMFPDDIVSNVNSAARMLERGDLVNAKRYIDKTGDDPRSYNNQGIYYLLNDDVDKAEEYFKKAIAQGVEEATHNLEETERKREDLRILERYKRK